MLLFLFKRLLQAVVVMFFISLISFSIQDNLGDPLRELVGQSVSAEEREALRDELGLNDHFLVQYSRFIGKALQGDLGTSYFFKEPALDVILDKLPATLELVFGAAIIILVVSIPAGVYSAINPHSFLTKCIMGFSVIGISVPVFLLAILMIYLFFDSARLATLLWEGRTDPDVCLLGVWFFQQGWSVAFGAALYFACQHHVAAIYSSHSC